MLKKYDADELKPYAEKLKQMAIDKLVSTFDVSDISFQSLTTSSGIGDATTHTLLCPNCHNQFTVTLNSDRYSYPSPICPHCGFSHGHAGASRGNHISMYSDKLKVSLENDIYAIREGNVIIAGTCDANANFVDNGTAYELIPDNANIFSIIAFGPEKAVYFKFEGENELKKMKYDKHGETYFTSYRPRWGAPYRPIHPEIKSWMDDMGFKDYSAVLDFYKSKRKVPTIVKPTIDPAAFREYDFSDMFEKIKDKMVVFISDEYDAIRKVQKTFYWCEHCQKEFMVEEESSGSVYGYGGYSRYSNATCPYCRNEDKHIVRPSVDKTESLGTVALFQEYNDAVITDGVIGRFYAISTKVMLDGDNRPFYEFIVDQEKPGYHSNTAYITLFNRENNKLACFSVTGGIYDNASIRDFNTIGFDSMVVDAVKGSWLSYIGLERYVSEGTSSRYYGSRNGMSVTRYLTLVSRYPVIEKIVKIGYAAMVSHSINACQTDPAYTGFIEMVDGKNTIDEAFGFPVKMANAVKHKISSLSDVYYFRGLYQLDKTADYADYIYAKDNRFTSVDVVFNLLKNINLKSIHAYMEGVRVHQCFRPDEAFGFWRDYLSTCKDLGMDVNDKQVKFPNSLKREHDKAIAKRSFVYDEEKNNAFMAQTSRCQELYGHETKEFTIRAPKDTKELFEEGRILSHSVGSYTDIISKGDTCIMFVRRTDDPDTPWYTLEINEKLMKIPEIKGYCNRLVDEEMEVPLCKFLVRWADRNKLNIDEALRTSKKIRAILAAEKKSSGASAA